MLNIVLFGPPGAGKGTQAVKLVEKYKLVHLSTGDIFRANIKGATELGKLAKSYMEKGDLVPDEVTIRMLESEVNKQTSPKGFIFDGFPRTTAQAQALDKFLSGKNLSITMTLALEVNEEELTKRIILRGKESGRADDQDENIVRNRVNEYNEKTAPLKDFYSKQGKLKTIQGIGSIDEIFNALCRAIDTNGKENMNRKEANDRVLELIEHYGTKDNSLLSVEFFFYADDQNSASNLSIELHRLGYKIYNVNAPDSISNQWSIIGCTSKMNIGEDAINEWSDAMEQLAKENKSRFDGWGTLIDPD